MEQLGLEVQLFGPGQQLSELGRQLFEAIKLLFEEMAERKLVAARLKAERIGEQRLFMEWLELVFVAEQVVTSLFVSFIELVSKLEQLML